MRLEASNIFLDLQLKGESIFNCGFYFQYKSLSSHTDKPPNTFQKR